MSGLSDSSTMKLLGLPQACALACLASSLAFSSQALAQQAPDAGRLQELTRPPAALPQSARPVLPAPPAAISAPPQDATPVAIKGFAFEGNRAFTAEQLTALLSDQISPATPFGQLRAALARINAAYAEKGYFLARAVIAQQDIAAGGGVLRIQVLEGQLGKVQGGALAADRLALAERIIAAQGLAAGQALHQGDLERSLMLIGERMGATTAALAPGAATGSTDVILQSAPAQKAWSAQIGLDNAGNRFSGQQRLLLDAAMRDLGTLGDVLSVRTQTASGLRFIGLAYSLPLGHQGLQLDLNASAMQYSLCCSFAPLQARGDSQIWGAGLRYPLLLLSDRSLIAEAAYSHKNSEDRTLGITNADKTAQPLSLGLAWTYAAALEGALLQSGRMGYTRGHLAQKINPNPNNPKRFHKLRADYSALFQASPSQQWLLRATGQAALSNLDSSEKFSLGGASGVRGWPAGEASGDSGALLSAEWRYQLNSTSRSIGGGSDANTSINDGLWTLSVFADTGQITQQKNPTTTSLPPGSQNSYSLSSAGVGLGYRSAGGWSLNAQLAKGLGSNPGKSAAGLNSDGRKRNTQLWLNAGMSF